MEEAPSLELIQTAFGNQGVEVVAINVLPQIPLEEWRQFLQDGGLKSAIVAQDTADYKAAKACQVRTAGATVVLNKKGEVVFRDQYKTSYGKLRLAVEKGL